MIQVRVRVSCSKSPAKPIGTAYTFSVLVMSFFDIGMTPKGIVEFTGKLKVSSPITSVGGS